MDGSLSGTRFPPEDESRVVPGPMSDGATPVEHPGDDMTEPATGIGRAEQFEFIHRSWPAYPRHLAALRAEVRRWLAPLALPRDAENDLLLAVNEAASNCIEHAYAPATVDGTVELTFWTEPRSVWVEIVDHGRWRTPSGQPTGRDRGIAVMQRLIPVVLIHYDSRGTRVLLSHPLPLWVPETRLTSCDVLPGHSACSR